jgi:hypothetical protein
MKNIKTDTNLIAYCGLYCGACGRFLSSKCPGCKENLKASWCKVRSCCIENKLKSCAECRKYDNAPDCKNFNNIISRVIGFVLRSNRAACIRIIKSDGYDKFAKYMAENKMQTIRR